MTEKEKKEKIEGLVKNVRENLENLLLCEGRGLLGIEITESFDNKTVNIRVEVIHNEEDIRNAHEIGTLLRQIYSTAKEILSLVEPEEKEENAQDLRKKIIESRINCLAKILNNLEIEKQNLKRTK